ncbi:MAG: NAD-dependent epimerase/dehydratase family protein [Candidatus Odinarchaeota archaeon]
MPAVEPSDGPVAVTGASGYMGSHVVIALMRHGYTIHACLRDPNNPDKTEHLLTLNSGDYTGHVELYTANLLEKGSYDEPFANCCAVLHVGTPMGYDGDNNPRQIYEGALNGTRNVLDSVQKVGTVKRFVYTSSFSAIYHPTHSGYVYTEKDWATDNRENDPNWSVDRIDIDGDMSYSMAKVEVEHLSNRFAEEDGRFDVISVCPIAVLGPLLSPVHERVGSWQWYLGLMLAGKPCQQNWQSLWNIVDVRDVAESQALIIESNICKNGWRYMLSAMDESGELDVFQLQAHLQKLFPNIDVGGAPDAIKPIIEKYGSVYQSPLAHCDKARKELDLETHSIEDTLYETGRTMIDLGLVKPALK